jgi:WD40 repeat protein
MSEMSSNQTISKEKRKSEFEIRQQEALKCFEPPVINVSRIGDRLASINSVAVTRDNKRIISGSDDKSISIWDFEKRKELHRFEDAHKGVVMSVAVSGDNKYIVSGSADKSIAIWDIEDKKCFHRFDNAHSSTVTSVVVTEDSKFIVSGSRDKSIAMWDIEDKKVLHRFEDAHSSCVNSVAVVAIVTGEGGGDNKNSKHYIVSGSKDGSIAIWDIEDKKCFHLFEKAHSSAVNSVAVVTIVTGEGENKKNNKQCIVSGSDDESIGIWDIEDRKLLHRFNNPYSGTVSSVAVVTGEGINKKNNKQYILSGSSDKSIFIWDIEDNKILHRFVNAHSDVISSVAVVTIGTEEEDNKKRNKQYIVSGSRDKSIAIWDIEDKKNALHRFRNVHSGTVLSVAALTLVTVVTQEGYKGEEIDRKKISKQYIVSGTGDNSIAIWDIEDKKPFHEFKDAHSGPVRSLAVATIVTGNKKKRSKQYIVSGSCDNSIAIWDIEDKKCFHRFEKAHSSDVYSVAVVTIVTGEGENKKRSKQYIVSGSDDKSIAIWDIEDKKVLHRFEDAHSDRVSSVAVTTEGGGDNKNSKHYIVSGSYDGSIAIWDIEDKKCFHLFEKAHSSAVNSVAVVTIVTGEGENKKNNKQCIVSGSDSNSIFIWDIEDKKLLHRFNDAHSGPVLSVAVVTGEGINKKNNKQYILSGSSDKSIAIWDIEDNKILHRFVNAHSDFISSVAVMTIGTEEEDNKKRNKQYIVSGSYDRTIAIWDIEDQKLLHQFESPDSGQVNSVAIMKVTGGEGDNNNNRQYIVSGSNYGTIAIWDIEGKKLLHRFEKILYDSVFSLAVVTIVTGDHKKSKKQYIVSGLSDTIAIWDIEERKLLHRFERVHSDYVNSVAVVTIVTEEGDNKNIKHHIVSGSKDGSIAIWDIEDKKCFHLFEKAHRSAVNSVAVVTIVTGEGENKKNNKQCIVSGSSDKSIAIWDVEEKKLSLRFENAHSYGVSSVAVVTIVAREGDNKKNNKQWIVSGSWDGNIAIWDIEEKKLLHRFENAYSYSGVSSVAVMTGGEDNKKNNKQYIVSGSRDGSIAIWDIEEKKLLHRFENAHSYGVSSVAVVTIVAREGDNKKNNKQCIVSGSYDGSIAIWDIQTPLQNLSFIPHLIANSITHSHAFANLAHNPPKISEISFLADIKLLSLNWNLLNFVIFLLPNVRPEEYLNFIVSNNIHISLDAYGKSQLQYLLDYPGKRTPEVYKFFSIFFKDMPKLINFNSLGREKLLNSLAKLTIGIYNTQPSASLLNYLKCFVRPAEGIFDSDDLAKLPNQGNLKNGQNQAFIKLKQIAVPSIQKCSDTIETVTDDSKNNYPTLQYELVLLPLDYYGNSPDTFDLLHVLESFEVEDDVFYADPTVNYLIDFLWERLKGYLHFQVFFFATNTALYTLFGIYYQDEQVSTPVLIIVVVMNGLTLIFEGLQESAGLDQFLNDPWNFFEIVTPIFQIISAILYSTDQGSLAETIFISTSILLLYTKFLITLRVFDPLRHMIRMILEILNDSKGFMIVIFTYAFGLTIAVYHNREVQQDSDGSGIYALNDVLMEMYAFAIGSWDYTEYAGINIAFFLFASFLLPLVLLNMLIALMGGTYARVQDNRQAFDNRERVLMLYELVSAAYQLKLLVNWIRGKSQESQEHKESFYLLVVKEFSISEGQIDMKSLNDGQKAIENKIQSIDNKIVDLKKEMIEMKKEIVSEILMAFRKKPSSYS